MQKESLEDMAESIIPLLKIHARLFYNEGWDELVDSYSDDEIFNTVVLNGISNIDDAIVFFHNRFNPNGDSDVSYNAEW